MKEDKEPIRDSRGQALQVGDVVRYLSASEDLLRGLPASDQRAIRSQVGRTMTIEGFDDYGGVELEFWVSDCECHSIWVEPRDLEKVGP